MLGLQIWQKTMFHIVTEYKIKGLFSVLKVVTIMIWIQSLNRKKLTWRKELKFNFHRKNGGKQKKEKINKKLFHKKKIYTCPIFPAVYSTFSLLLQQTRNPTPSFSCSPHQPAPSTPSASISPPSSTSPSAHSPT